MEGIPVIQYPDLATHQPGAYARPAVQPPVPEQSLDSTPPTVEARPAPTPLKKRKQNKTVRWDHSVIDNEKKTKASLTRPLTPFPPKNSTSSAVSRQSSINSNPSQRPSISTLVPDLKANISVRMDAASVRRPTHRVIASSQGTFPRQDPWYSIHRPDQHVEADAVKRSPTHIPSIQRTVQAPVANSSSKRNHDPRGPRFMVPGRSSPPKDVTKVKKERQKTTSIHVPPRVPDPPQPKMQGPPPTPRITRLPSPNLSDISERRFCMCANCKRLAESNGKPIHVKMNAQMEAAMAYMKGVKK